MGQNERMASLDRFKTAETPLLVATDVAARGLDIPNVEYVVNYTFPSLSKITSIVLVVLVEVERLANP